MTVFSYTDGSYNPNNHIIGCAILLLSKNDKRSIRIVYRKKLKSHTKYGSNIAEMKAVKTAIKTALSLGYKEINIYHDWTGVELFSYRENIKNHLSSCPYFAEYAKYLEIARKCILINFIKVKAHSDNELNRIVDKMAKIGQVIQL